MEFIILGTSGTLFHSRLTFAILVLCVCVVCMVAELVLSMNRSRRWLFGSVR